MNDKCALCGTQDNDLKTDHLRECYKISQSKLDHSQYAPKLFYQELNSLQLGSNIVCNNRKKCRNRKRVNLLTSVKT